MGYGKQYINKFWAIQQFKPYNKLIVAKMKNSSSTQSLKKAQNTFIFCYICGRQYGSKSFSIHIKTCIEKFKNQQELKTDSKDKISLPEPPLLLDIILSGSYESNQLKIFNDEAYQIYKYKVLPKCKFCQRTFNYESLKVHQKGCDKRPKIPVFQQNYFEDKELSRPKTLLCCVCGRQFGTKSLKIHYPQCLDKFKNDEFMRCPNPKDRRRPPEFSQQQIELFNTKQNWNNEELEEFYKMAMAKYRNESMMECYNCKRKFIPDSIEKHMKNCILINGNLNPEAHMKKVQSEKVLHFYQKNIKKPKTLMCYICGRQFGLTSLIIHQKKCYQMFKIEQQNRPKNQRKKLPQLPQEINNENFDISNAQNWQIQKIEKYNLIISDLYNKKTLVQCYICQRTFFEQSLQKHIVHCENNLQKLKLKRNKSHDQNEIVKRCESVQKLRKIQKSVQKNIVKPRVLMCHICGRQFGTASLKIHVEVCQQKFMNEQSQKNKQQRKPLPKLPEEVSNAQYNIKLASQWSNQKIQFYNKIVSEFYNKKTLQMCPYCERTFLQESLAKHIKHCEKYTLQKIKRSPSLSDKQLRILSKYNEIKQQKLQKQNQYYAKVQKSVPKTLVCHICGRSYGLSSLQIHLPNCIKKFINLQSQKPSQQRKKLPSIQNQIDSLQFDIKKAQTWSKQKIQAYNQVCNKVYNHKSLTKCQYCQRTFFDEQIKKHITFCQKQTIKSLQKSSEMSVSKKKPLLKKSQSLNCDLLTYAQKQVKQPVQSKMLFCYICGRQFGVYSLKIHFPQCQEKFVKYQQSKPQENRKKLPQLQFNFNENKQNSYDFNITEAQLWDGDKIKRFNQFSRQTYMKCSLYQCQHCGRSFKQEQLPKHLKFCQKDPFKKVKKNEQTKLQIQPLQDQDKQVYSPRRKVKIQENVIPIIQEEQPQHSTISPYQISPLQQEKHKKSLNGFSLIPIQVSPVGTKDKSVLLQKPKKLTTSSVNSSFSNLNKSLKDISLKKETSITRSVKRSLSYNADLGLGLSSMKKQEEKNQKQCEHCKKNVKTDLYQRHIHMCKSNSSMTGYMRKDTAKLKI